MKSQSNEVMKGNTMKQEVTIIESNKVTVSAGIMPLDSKKWNEGLDDDDRFAQIPLKLTFDLTGVVGKNEITEISPLIQRAMDGYFIDARQSIKFEANEDMSGKTKQEKYDRMKELVPGWEKMVFKLPIRSGRQPGEASKLKAKVHCLITQTNDLMDMHIRFAEKIKASILIGIIRKAQQIPENEWLAQKGIVEAELINSAKKSA